MIIEVQPNIILPSHPPQWWLYYKEDNQFEFKRICVTHEKLKLFLETYGYETNNILELKNFGINTTNIKQNVKL